MEIKVDLQQGFCETLHYNSLNYVEYISEDKGEPFKKSKMACSAVKNGLCDKAETCEILKAAPEQYDYKDWHLQQPKN